MTQAPDPGVYPESTDSVAVKNESRHRFCKLCFPNLAEGVTAMAICGTVKTLEKGRGTPGNEVPPNACIVCLDDDLMLAHAQARHGLG